MLASSTQALLSEALDHLVAALELLDAADAPGDIGARVDHARARLEEKLRGPLPPGAEPFSPN